MIERDVSVSTRYSIFIAGAAIAWFGVWISSHRKWRDVPWALVPFLLHACVLVESFVWDWWTEFQRPYSSSDGPNSDWTAGWVGDLDGDGHDDFFLSTPLEPRSGFAFGAVRIFSGRDGSRIIALNADGVSGFENATGAGDVDGDGRADLLVQTVIPGQMRAFSGSDWREILSVSLNPDSSMASAGDLDGDGHGDLWIWKCGAAGGGKSRGAVRLISGKDGSTLRDHVGERDLESLGWSLCVLGDVDGDGTPDYAISNCPGTVAEPLESTVFLRSGRDGRILREIHEPGFRHGIDLERTSDLDRDGVDDLLIGGDVRDPKGKPNGIAFALVSAREGRIAWRRSVADGSYDLRGVGDVDHDGCPDFCAGRREESRIVSGLKGKSLYLAPNRTWGSGWGDADGDGYADLLRLSNRQEAGGAEGSREVMDHLWHEGSLEVVSGKDGTVLARIDGTTLLGSR